jgi:predicted anti-sigma-YlaC factor YlaD
MSGERLAAIELENRVALLEKRLAELEVDNHYFQTRPCETCRNISATLGRPYGCSAKAIRKSNTLPIVNESHT